MFHLRMSPLIYLLTVLVFIAGSLPASADIAPVPACEVTVDDSPADGAEEVPLNPMLLYGAVAPFDCVDMDEVDPYDCGWMPEFSLTDEEGAAVAVTAEFVTKHCVLVFFPDEDLQPNSVYHVLEEEELLATFTTGSTADLQAPAFTASQSGPSSSLRFEYTSDEPLVLAAVVLGGMVGYGVTPRDSSLDVSSYPDHYVDSGVVDVTVYDAAGNSASAEFTFDRGTDDDDDDGEPESCACTQDAAAAMPSALLACCGLLGATWMRRRRSDRD